MRMKIRTTAGRALVAGLALLAMPIAGRAQLPATEYEGAQALGLELRRLGHTKRVLMIGAHPDDESTQILSTLALGQGVRVAYLSLTRGEGGQNGIGPDLGEGLGLLRSEELLSARRLDGADQFFTRAYDFGYSKSADEAFRHWPRDSVLADVVAVIRWFRPDVVVTIFSGTERDGHGQHEGAGILAREAYDAAGDPDRFPTQVGRGLKPHAPAKLLQASWRRDDNVIFRLETGQLDPLLGRSHFQVAMASRSRHRSQDMGQILAPGPRTSGFSAVRGGTAENGSTTLFSGIDTTLTQAAVSSGLRGSRAAPVLAQYERTIGEAVARFDGFRPAALVPSLTRALALLDRAQGDADRDEGELPFELRQEREELEAAIWRAAGLRLDAVVDDELVVPGQSFELDASLWNGGEDAIQVTSLEPALPAGWTAEPRDPLPGPIPAGAIATRRFLVRVAADAPPSEPYFNRVPRRGDMYVWPDSVHVGVPFEPPLISVRAVATVAGRSVPASRGATYRGLDKMQGEVRRPLHVVPVVSVSAEPALAIVPISGGTPDPVTIAVRLASEAANAISGVVRLDLPPGWRSQPREARIDLPGAGEARTVEIVVLPPSRLAPGGYAMRARFVSDSGDSFARGYELVDYPHTAPRPLYRPSSTDVRVLDVRVPSGLRVGYVAGPGDEVQNALQQMGVSVEPLGPGQLASGDLSRFDVIVTGIRAYEVRPDLAVHNQRLLDFARAGGTLIVQYNKYEFTEPGIAPFPVEMSRPHDRVTDEGAPVRLLDPAHPVFTTPNRITRADFDGWVHERGLYFLSDWPDSFTPLLESSDPGEPPLRGGLLVAPLGAGTYVYTGLAFFRQLPAGVPGAYRLFANLLALGDPR
jgi:LmbE family N-acetylglucosaminyl deacetylase